MYLVKLRISSALEVLKACFLIVKVDAFVVEHVKKVEANARCSTLSRAYYFFQAERAQIDSLVLEDLLLCLALVLEKAVELLALVNLRLLRKAVAVAESRVKAIVVLLGRQNTLV